jgi:protein SCO1
VSLLLGVLLCLCGCSASSVAAPSPDLGQQADVALSTVVTALPLVDPQGKPTSLGALRGKTIVLVDFLTACQDTCPLTSADMVQMARIAERDPHARDTVFVEVTVDPGRDTPARLAAYRRLFPTAPANWLLLTGSPSDLGLLWRYLGVYYQKVKPDGAATTDWYTRRPLAYDVDHSNILFFIDARGHERFVINAAPAVVGGSIPPALYRQLDAQGRHNLTSPDLSGSWTPEQALGVLSWLLNHRLPAA